MILDELGDEILVKIRSGVLPSKHIPSGFYHNRAYIIDAYNRGCLFGLRVSETDAMFEDEDSRINSIFMKMTTSWPFGAKTSHCGATYPLPCFAIVENKTGDNNCLILWVAERARGYGFGSKLVAGCKVTHASSVLIQSTGFWRKIGFELDGQSKCNSSWRLNPRC